jgi:hypothetical protein
MPDPAKPLRVLVSEGSSTSAREAITILGRSGHDIEVCDPSPWCLSRFSGLVRKFHRCPGLRDDPAGYLAFIKQRLADRKFDVLLPTHEQDSCLPGRSSASKARECVRLFAHSGPYAGSSEELMPVETDWISAVPLVVTAALLLASPKSEIKLARGGFGAHLLDLGSIRAIESGEFGE